MGLDHEGYLPAFVSLTDGQTSDIAEARRLAWRRGSMVVCDKGYTDFAWYQALMDQGIWFVTRARDNACFEVLSPAEPRHENVLFDQTVRMTGVKPRAIGLRPLRRVAGATPRPAKSTSSSPTHSISRPGPSPRSTGRAGRSSCSSSG